jgi:hypothetical protein
MLSARESSELRRIYYAFLGLPDAECNMMACVRLWHRGLIRFGHSVVEVTLAGIRKMEEDEC